jgi:hypothetical protein
MTKENEEKQQDECHSANTNQRFVCFFGLLVCWFVGMFLFLTRVLRVGVEIPQTRL